MPYPWTGSGNQKLRAFCYQTVFKDGLALLKNAQGRLLTILRCYRYNLEEGALVTGVKVEKRVEDALKMLVIWGLEDYGRDQVVGDEAEEKSKQSWEISDEERVVAEVGFYLSRLMNSAGEVPSTVTEVAGEILEWGKRNGTAERREVEITYSLSRLGQVEC